MIQRIQVFFNSFELLNEAEQIFTEAGIKVAMKTLSHQSQGCFLIIELNQEDKAMSNIQQFIELPAPMPPMLPKMVGVSDGSKYFALCYQGSKATWSNGRGLGTFSYYAVYEPLIHHITLAIHLDRYNLGSDDQLPEHAILCDGVQQKMYVGSYQEIDRFLQQQHSQEPHHTFTPEELEAAMQAVENWSIEEMQRMGMFEMFGSTNPQARQQTTEMVQWLDQYITEDLIQQYVYLANRGNYTAMRAIETLKLRIAKAQKQQQQTQND
jgi:hypothetical protein